MNHTIHCEICIEQFTHKEGYVPRVLPCGHTFCEGCIEKLKSLRRNRNVQRRNVTFDYTVSCPRCWKETILNKCSSTLPKNYSYLDLIEEVLEKQKKDVCSDHPNYTLDMFCHDDAKVICLNCAVYGQHKRHCFSRLSGFCDHQKTSLKYQVNCAECLMRDCNSLLKEVEARKAKLTAKFDKIQDHITSIFCFIKCEVNKMLDEKLESVLNDLKRMSKTQLIRLDENSTQLHVSELEALKNKTNSFLENASECEIAKENQLSNDIETCIKHIQTRKLYTEHRYEVKLDSWEYIIETMNDFIDAWDFQVNEKVKLSTEDIPSILEKYLPSIESSMCVLFGDKDPVEILHSPFEGIDVTCEKLDF